MSTLNELTPHVHTEYADLAVEALGKTPDTYYTGSQVLEYGRQCRAAALEDAAKLCDRRSLDGSPPVAADEAGLLAEQIRALH